MGSFLHLLWLVAFDVLLQRLDNFAVDAVIVGFGKGSQAVPQVLFHSDGKDRISQLRFP